MVLRTPFLIIVLCCGMALPAVAQEVARGDTNDVYETRHNYVLGFPRLLWDVLVYPLGAFTIWVEHEEVPERVMGLFTNESGTFGLFPYVSLGGETGTGGGFTTFHTNLFGRGKGFGGQFVMAAVERYRWQALYSDPGSGGGAWYWNALVEGLKTDSDDATINGLVHDDIDNLFDTEQGDARATFGWHSDHGELEGYRPDTAIELRLGYGWRNFAGNLPVAGVGQSIGMFSVGGRIAYDDRDYKEATRQILHPLNYHFPGRVLFFANDLYYSLRDIAFPERGGLLQAEADLVSGSKDVRFLRYGAEAQRFFTLFYSNRILGLRARLEKLHEIGDEKIIPYSDLLTLGGSQRLRGFGRGAFRGAGTLLLSAEYRYPIWDTWNAFLFWEEGQVFDQYDQIEMEEFHSAFGAGISLRTENAFLLGLRIAHSVREDVLLGFSLEQEF